MKKDAYISEDGLYRYDLWRSWDGGDYAMFIGLNPSTADAENDDPTIRRCIRFARDWGHGALCMVNLFAFRATKPSDMQMAADPVGSLNDQVLRLHAGAAKIIVAAWGAHGVYRDRNTEVAELLWEYEVMCLGKTKNSGQPRHPLYLLGDTVPEPLWKPNKEKPNDAVQTA